MDPVSSSLIPQDSGASKHAPKYLRIVETKAFIENSTCDPFSHLTASLSKNVSYNPPKAQQQQEYDAIISTQKKIVSPLSK